MEKRKSKCRTKFCRGIITLGCHSPFCAKCRSRNFKLNHPLKYAFAKLRHRAIERGHEFQLSFEQYEEFALGSGYAELKGKNGHSLSIDRIDPAKGYSAGNIRAVTLSQNSRLRYAPLPDYMKAELEAES